MSEHRSRVEIEGAAGGLSEERGYIPQNGVSWVLNIGDGLALDIRNFAEHGMLYRKRARSQLYTLTKPHKIKSQNLAHMCLFKKRKEKNKLKKRGEKRGESEPEHITLASIPIFDSVRLCQMARWEQFPLSTIQELPRHTPIPTALQPPEPHPPSAPSSR